MSEPATAPTDSFVTDGLAARSHGGDSAAGGALYLRLAPVLAVWAALHLVPALRRWFAPEDFVHEVWLVVLRRMPEFDANRASFRAWVFGTAKNKVFEACRRAGKLRRDIAAGEPSDCYAPDPATTPARKALKREVYDALMAALDDYLALQANPRRFGVEKMRMIILGMLEGKTVQEISEDSGIPRNTVSQHKFKLLEYLRRRLPANVAAGFDILS